MYPAGSAPIWALTTRAPHDRTMSEGGMDHKDDDDVSKSRKLEKRRIHKQKQRANFSAKIEFYEVVEARTEHMGFLIKGHFDEEPDRTKS